MRNEFYKDTQGVILAYDVGQKESFKALESWLTEMKQELGPHANMENIVFVVCANKVTICNITCCINWSLSVQMWCLTHVVPARGVLLCILGAWEGQCKGSFTIHWTCARLNLGMFDQSECWTRTFPYSGANIPFNMIWIEIAACCIWKRCEVDTSSFLCCVIPFSQVDCGKRRVIDESEGRLWAENRGFYYFETSAQSGEGINEMFQVCLRVRTITASRTTRGSGDLWGGMFVRWNIGPGSQGENGLHL